MVVAEKCLAIVIIILVIDRLRPAEHRTKTTPPAGRIMKEIQTYLEN